MSYPLIHSEIVEGTFTGAVLENTTYEYSIPFSASADSIVVLWAYVAELENGFPYQRVWDSGGHEWNIFTGSSGTRGIDYWYVVPGGTEGGRRIAIRLLDTPITNISVQVGRNTFLGLPNTYYSPVGAPWILAAAEFAPDSNDGTISLGGFREEVGTPISERYEYGVDENPASILTAYGWDFSEYHSIASPGGGPVSIAPPAESYWSTVVYREWTWTRDFSEPPGFPSATDYAAFVAAYADVEAEGPYGDFTFTGVATGPFDQPPYNQYEGFVTGAITGYQLYGWGILAG